MGTFYKEVLFFLHMKPSCPSGYVPPAPLASPRAETPSGVSQLGLLPLLFPALQVVRSRGGGLGMHLFFCPGGFLPCRWISVQREGWECFWTIVCCARARSCFANSFGSWRRVSCSIAAVFFYDRYTPRLTFTIPRRTFDDVGNCGSLRRIATAFYPLVVSDLRIVVLVWIRELVHGRVVFVDRGRFSRSRSSSC